MKELLPTKKIVARIAVVCFLLTIAHACTRAQTGKVVKGEGEFPLIEYWSFSATETISAVAAGNGALVVSAGGKIYALDPASGETLWAKDAYGWALNITNGIVYAADSSELSAFKLDSGEVLWTTKLENGSSHLEIANVSSKYVFLVQPGAWVIEAYDIESGELAWKAFCSRGRTDIVGTDDGYVMNDDKISVYGSYSMPILTRQEEGSTGPGLFESGILYYQVDIPESKSEKMFAVNASDFSRVWEKSSVPTAAAISKSGNYIFLSTYRGVTAIDALSGKDEWDFNITEEFMREVIVLEDVVYAKASNTKRIYALSVEDGKLLGNITIIDDSDVEPYASYAAGVYTADGLLFFSSRNRLYAYGKP